MTGDRIHFDYSGTHVLVTGGSNGIGLGVARELEGRDVTAALLTELNEAAPERQALIMLAMADRGDRQALPTLLKSAESG